MPLTVNEFLDLRSSYVLLDVRSENEFLEGHIPGAVNIPLLNNDERIQVGTDYKQKGKDEAIRTGFKLVGPRLSEMVDQALQMTNGRESLVYCWRGGMRSHNFCQFIGMAGMKTQILIGGYKAYRHNLMDFLGNSFPFIVLTGCTGSGKSEMLRTLKVRGEQVIDLEGIANHKGSAFGALMMPPQPTSEQFQNELMDQIRSMDFRRRIWIEDEGFAIGKVYLPSVFWNKMHDGPLVQMMVDKEIRVQRLVKEYGRADPEAFLAIMTKIVKKLGGQHFNVAKEKIIAGDWASTIDILLTYYDKAYLRSIEERTSKIISQVAWNGISTDQYAEELIGLFEKKN